MKKLSLIFCSAIVVSACQTTPNVDTASRYSQLAVTDLPHAEGPLSVLARSEPLYPVEQAKAGGEGCATLEYVVTPDYQIHDVTVRDTVGRFFAREAKAAIEKWQWQQLPAGLLTEPVKLQTRFEFCLENGEGRCAPEQLNARTQCRGDDLLPVVGRRVVVRH